MITTPDGHGGTPTGGSDDWMPPPSTTAYADGHGGYHNGLGYGLGLAIDADGNGGGQSNPYE